MSRRHHLSDKKMLDLLRGKAIVLGRPPSYHEVAWDRNMPHPGLYRRRFGSWQEALEAAGYGDVEEDKVIHDRRRGERRRKVIPDFPNDRRREDRRRCN